MTKTMLARVRSGGNVRMQEKTEPEASFSKAKKQCFLESLAETVNVTASARAAGVAVTTLYRHKHKDAVFDEAWQAALTRDYDNLEMMMLERALSYNRALLANDGAVPTGMAAFSNGDAMRLLKMHRDTVEARRARVAARPKWNGWDKEDRRLEKKLNEMRARMEANAARCAAQDAIEAGAACDAAV